MQEVQNNKKSDRGKAGEALLRRGGLEFNGFLVDFLTGGVDIHISPHHQLMSFGIPEKDFIPYFRGQIQPENHHPVRNSLGSIRPRHFTSLHQRFPLCVLAVTLIKPIYSVVSYGMIIGVGTIIEGEIKVIVPDTFVLHTIIKLEIEVNTVIASYS